jgi:hypothetical protein
VALIRRAIEIAVVEDIDLEMVGIEVSVPEGMTTLEAIGLMQIGLLQHLGSKHEQGPTVYQTPDQAPARRCCPTVDGAHSADCLGMG